MIVTEKSKLPVILFPFCRKLEKKREMDYRKKERKKKGLIRIKICTIN